MNTNKNPKILLPSGWKWKYDGEYFFFVEKIVNSPIGIHLSYSVKYYHYNNTNKDELHINVDSRTKMKTVEKLILAVKKANKK